MNVSKQDKSRYLNVKKGYAGEVNFDHLSKEIHEDRLILNDLLLEVNHSFFQIDTLIISRGVIHLIDIKNFSGDCYLQGDKLYSVKSNSEYKNPIHQLKRCETLFTQLLEHLNYNYLIKSSIIFINPNVTLYQAPLDQPIVLPSQLDRFIDDLKIPPPQLSNQDKALAQQLLSLHQPKNPFHLLPKYRYDELKKGVYCHHCNSYLVSVEKHNLVCFECGSSEKTRHAILRNTEEFQLLFPERKITTNTIDEWCNGIINKKTIQRVLKQNYNAIGEKSGRYYEVP
jgi:DNA-directed RNA polymerase subunit M/transcription elongation factor TFIIS